MLTTGSKLVFGAPLSVAAANSHVAGCAAILRDQIPVNPLSALGLMDLLYCMVGLRCLP